MSDSTPVRFANRELAQRIAKINGGKALTIPVTMVGGEDVAKLLRKVKRAREVAPSATFRVK